MREVAVRAAPEGWRILGERQRAIERRGVVTIGAAHGDSRRERTRGVDGGEDRPAEHRCREPARRALQDLAIRDLADDAFHEEGAAPRDALEIDRRSRHGRRYVGERAAHGHRRVHARDRHEVLGREHGARAARERVSP
jgi:hypothetical protein